MRAAAMPLALAAILAFAALRGEDSPATFVLQWNHQAQFAGYYMAEDLGLYRAEGIDLRMRRGGPDVSPSDEVAAGRADFCSTMLSTALEARAGGKRLVLISQVVNRSNFVLVAWRNPPGAPTGGIQRPADLDGRKVSVWESDFRLPYLAFFAAQGLKPELLPQYYSLSLFLHHGVDACSAMHYNEYHRLLQNGVRERDIVVFKLRDHGVQLPEDGLYALEGTWRERPELCRAFVRASMEGWRRARENPAVALDAVMRRVEADQVPTNRPHMRWMLVEMLRSIFPEAGDDWVAGRLSRDTYAKAAELLRVHGGLGSVAPYGEFVSGEADDAHR